MPSNKSNNNFISLSDIYKKSKNLVIKDKTYIKKKIRKIQKQKQENNPEHIKKINLLYSKAKNNAYLRKKSMPVPEFDLSLPINSKKKEIVEAIKKNQVLIISGETGSGKTTQLPKLCILAGRGIKGEIACTQPRRIAAVSVAERIAEELKQPIGENIGYKIRFKNLAPKNSVIKIMTDGILLAETLTDRFLNEYDTIIIDEAHERSLNIDFLLGFLINLIKKRKDLKIIITSATIDTEKFSKAFGNAPIIEVSGRTYPVETIYLPDEKNDDENEETELSILASNAADLIEDDGDILIFMPTENDIMETIEKLRGRNYKNSVIMPLYARLPSHLQQKVFRQESKRKIIVATNVAETSITIPGIKYVIDTGLARIPKYIPNSRTTSLPVSKISKSSADQRQGRCGRVANGICIRLYSEEDYNERPRFTPPEILRSNLADVLLKMTALQLGDIKKFPFIDNPESKNINDGYNLLTELGAVKETNKTGFYKLTQTGRKLAKIPLDPKLSRMLVEASEKGCLEEVTKIVSGITSGDPRQHFEENKEKAVAAHKIFKDPLSDFISILNIWTRLEKESKGKITTGNIGRFAKKYYLSFKKIREWRDLYSQIKNILEEEKIKNQVEKPLISADKNAKTAPLYEAIHKAILTGYLSNIAVKTEKNFFRAAKNRAVMIFPGSGIFNNTPEWIVAAEIVETSRLFARTAGYVEPEWIAHAAKNLVKETIYNPHYEKNTGSVVAYCQKMLYGLILSADSKVIYKKYDKENAARIFFSQALYTGEVKENFGFLKKNKKTREEITALEEKLRKRDILVSEEAVIDFYEKKIPGISDIRSLKDIIRKKGDDFLVMKKEDLMNYNPEKIVNKNFPDFVNIGNERFKCSYRFNPGSHNDGITISVPAHKSSSLSAVNIENAVPGIINEKIESILKGLPKKYRMLIAPIKEKVKIISNELDFNKGPLSNNLASFIQKRFKVLIPPKIISEVSLPPHLQVRLELVDSKGSRIDVSRDFSILRTINIDYKTPTYSKPVKDFKKKYEKTDLKEFETVQELIKIYPDKKNSPVLYPGFYVNNNNVSLKLFEDKSKADESHVEGVKFFYEKLFAAKIKNLKKQTKMRESINKVSSFLFKKEDVEQGILDCVLNKILLKNIRKKEDFDNYYNEIKEKRLLDLLLNQKKESTENILKEYSYLIKFLNTLEAKYIKTKLISNIISNCKKEASNLVPVNFYKLYSVSEMEDILRYMKALKIRAERGIGNPAGDYKKNELVSKFKEKLKNLLDELDEGSTPEKRKATESFFWDIEEFKISVFAQEIKTKYKISQKKLEKKYVEISKMI
ncbi:MAG: ATP-dependent RNA helicase HrpA [Deltaproteobacteria bacterium]|nr:MAG: ATP-dependent RNA helicase HrpA [Deltaproteobacteria bacterium]